MKSVESIFKVFGLLFTLVIFPLFLLWIGYSHIPHLFTGEFTQHLGSIEVSYITMAKFIQSSLPRFLWQPLWYLGYPMDLLYTPLVPFFEFFSNILFGWSFGHGYRVLTAVGYVCGLASWYFFARTLFKNSVAGLFAALTYGIMPSLVAFMYEEVAKDRFGIDIVDPRRFTILVRWGEGPHIVSLMFMPLAALFFVKFLRSGTKWSLIAGSIFSALVLLTNSVGTYGLAMLGVCLVIGAIAEQRKQWSGVILRSVVFGLFSYGWAAFWFNPLFISNFFQEGGGALGYWRDQFPWGWLLLGGGFTILFFLAKKITYRVPGLTAAILFFLIMFGLVNTYYASGSERLELVPQVLRLTTELDMAVSLAVAAFFGVVGTLLLKKQLWWYRIGMATSLIFVIPFLFQQLILVQDLPQHTLPLESTGKTLEQTPEYEIAQELQKLVSGDERVLVPGNYAFYLNYFSDLPQLRGALFQSSIHYWPDHIYYQMMNGKDADVSLAWLKITNVGWLVYNGPREVFRDYKVKPEKFDEILTLEKENLGDRYYKVPLVNNSLAKAVPGEILDNPVPQNAIDKEPIFRYVESLEAGMGMEYKQTENGAYEITGDVLDDQLVLVQQAFAPGWKAKDTSGKSLEVKPDPLGFITIKPKAVGTQTITLTYGKTWRVWIGWIISVLTIIASICLLFFIKKPMFIFSENTAQKKAAAEDE